MEDGIRNQLRPSSIWLYLAILHQAQKKSSPVLLFNTSSILEMLGVGRGHLRTARAQLQEYSLVGSTEVRRGLWMFEILSPSGIGLDSTLIDLGKLSTEKVKSFYLPHLGDCDAIFTTDGNLVSRCPFCHNLKAREKPFHLKLKDDGKGIGVWHCFACEKAGGMIQFEMQRTKTWGKPEEARKQVLNFFMRQREGDPNAPAQTTLSLPSGEHYQLEDEPTPI
jgi:hypothetical protein